MSVDQAPSDTDRAIALASFLGHSAGSRLVVAVIPGNPPTKTRARVGRGGRVYHDPLAKKIERRTADAIKEVIKGEKFTGNTAVGCIFFRGDRRHQDVDNLLKHVCDAANGVAWVDDSQVTAVLGLAEYDPTNPRTILVLTTHESSLRRGTDDVVACKGCGSPIERKVNRLYCGDGCGRVTNRKAPPDAQRH